ncbi:HupE/UreJ family protein [Sphingobium sp. HBC34]|uniref:HupE/UreJ family protein n=1 Tax=Sphingobium cyanobacteriorum TaxID=3063954 RepID=A0ABT8ZMX8_9SPHN|nr:HupE/UreJ family protein [Sphingobium sp. HBC34]MDO7835537.1 HupE/UreJ family protein [Sphingobium sp. HBC34]
MRHVAAPVRLMLLAALALSSTMVLAHDVSAGDRAFVQTIDGPAFIPFLYLGAKHMVTGYDHILFLIGVVFYLRRLRDVALYVSMFTIGHSTTLLVGVLLGVGANAHIVDAIIAVSVVYKGLENVGALRKVGLAFDPKVAVLVFGLFHGLGLATKLMDLSLSRDGLLPNLIGFNLGVEIGQIIVLALVVSLLSLWRDHPGFRRGALAANILLILAGMILTVHQLQGYRTS